MNAVSSLVLESRVIVLVAAAVLLCLYPRLWLDADGRLRSTVTRVAWVLACAMIALTAIARPIYDDEVFYMANAFAVRSGEVTTYLPLRVWPYYPLLALHLPPAATLAGSRIVMILAAILAGLMVRAIASRVDESRSAASLAGALALLSFANMPLGTMVPEYFAFLFLLAALWVVTAAPAGWPRAFCLFAYGLLVASACVTSLRLVLFGAAALVAACVEPGRMTRARAFLWTCAGMLAGGLPSVLLVLVKSSIAEAFYWFYELPNNIGLVQITSPVSLPAVLTLTAGVGCWFLWKSRSRVPVCWTLILFWGTATVSAILNPQKLEHSTGPWLALSFIVATAALSGVLSTGTGIGSRRLFVLIVVLLFAGQADPVVTVFNDPSQVRDDFAQARSGLRLIDWLSETANGRPVACVPPFHPIFAPNAWNMWNTVYYCYIREPEINRELEPHLEQTLLSNKAAVVQWDPWPTEAGVPNTLQYLVDRQFASAEELPGLAADLAGNYRLVQWLGPIDEEFGGGRFLVRRDIKLDGRVEILDDSLILHPAAQ